MGFDLRLTDRLIHHCHIVNVRGNSYRMRRHAELYSARRSRRDPPSLSRRGRAREVPTT